MDWQAFGFRDDPLKTSPVKQNTLELFTGHSEEIQVCENVLKNSSVRIIIEGNRGVGTTSFANYLRFRASAKKTYFTPSTEIKVEQGWRLETLLAAIISNIVREIELFPENEKILKNEFFQAAKALSTRIAEAYRSFGVDAFGFGANYGKQTGAVTQPILVPSTTLGHHLEDLIALVRQLGFKHGVLIQLNNLDIGEIHDVSDMKYLLNALRDYMQIEGSSWLLVGDVGLREFIAQNVDRLDDIISHETIVEPLPIKNLPMLIQNRVKFYSDSDKASLPIDIDVFQYLYELTNGRLRYVFGLVSRLLNRLFVGDLTDKITLDIAKPMVIKLCKDRILRKDLTEKEENILKLIVEAKFASASEIAKKLEKTSQYIGRTFVNLAAKNIIFIHKIGREKIYQPSIDALVAYSKKE